MFLLNNQQNNAVRAPPTCNTPVGLGAKRVLIMEEPDFRLKLRRAILPNNFISGLRIFSSLISVE
jgi:hypothetical protein